MKTILFIVLSTFSLLSFANEEARFSYGAVGKVCIKTNPCQTYYAVSGEIGIVLDGISQSGNEFGDGEFHVEIEGIEFFHHVKVTKEKDGSNTLYRIYSYIERNAERLGQLEVLTPSLASLNWTLTPAQSIEEESVAIRPSIILGPPMQSKESVYLYSLLVGHRSYLSEEHSFR